MGTDEVLYRYVPYYERQSILTEAHGGVARGHYVGRATAQKIPCVGFWWLAIQRYSSEYCRACDVCQRNENPSLVDEFPLNLKVSL